MKLNSQKLKIEYIKPKSASKKIEKGKKNGITNVYSVKAHQ